jgi:hypothetical protein
MIQYPNYIQDHHVVKKLREIIDAVNGLVPAVASHGQAIASTSMPSIADIQQALSIGGSNPLPLTSIVGSTVTPSAIVGTHASRLALTPAEGTFYQETDRTYLYIGEIVSTVAAWVYSAGRYSDVLANQPADLGSNDAGALFLATDTAQHFRWTGSAWLEEQSISDAATSTTESLLNLIHRSSGTPTTGFGASLSYQLDNSVNALKSAGFLDVVWATATSTHEAADFVFRSMHAGGAAAEVARITNSGGINLSGASPFLNSDHDLTLSTNVGGSAANFDTAQNTTLFGILSVTGTNGIGLGTNTGSATYYIDHGGTDATHAPFRFLNTGDAASGIEINRINSLTSLIITTNSGNQAVLVDANQSMAITKSLLVAGTSAFGIGADAINSGEWRMDVGGSSGVEYRFLNNSNALTGAILAQAVVGSSDPGGSDTLRVNGTTRQQLSDAVTNATESLLNLIHRSSGTPTTNFGASLQYELDSSTNVLRSAGALDVIWTTATNTSETAAFVVRLMSGGSTEAEMFRVTPSGITLQGSDINATTAPMLLQVGAVSQAMLNAAARLSFYKTGNITWTGDTTDPTAAADSNISRFAAGILAIGTGAQGSNSGQLQVSQIIGGNSTSSTLTLQSTSVAGATDSIIFQTGSQVTAMTIDTSQILHYSSRSAAAVPANFVANFYLHIKDLGGNNFYIPGMNAAW